MVSTGNLSSTQADAVEYLRGTMEKNGFVGSGPANPIDSSCPRASALAVELTR